MVKYLLRVQVARVRFPPKPPFLKEAAGQGIVGREDSTHDIVWVESSQVEKISIE